MLEQQVPEVLTDCGLLRWFDEETMLGGSLCQHHPREDGSPERTNMRLIRHVVVFDAADIDTESRFWAAMLDGLVIDDDPRFHCVIDRDGNWMIGVQHAPDHTPPDWPDGAPQQIHLDLHVDDPRSAIAEATRLGARPLRTDSDLADDRGHHVLADPAGHPFCIGWGHPDADTLRQFLGTRAVSAGCQPTLDATP